jgi:signal transduction histidine kinase
LGLAAAHQIAAEHGGTISLESQIGTGTTVTVRVPLEVESR